MAVTFPSDSSISAEDLSLPSVSSTTGRHRAERGELLEAVAEAIASSGGGGGSGLDRKAIVTILTAVIALASALGAGNWAVMSTGDADTQAMVKAELQIYGDKMELKVGADRQLLRDEMARDRINVADKIAAIEKSTQQTAIDIAVIKSRISK